MPRAVVEWIGKSDDAKVPPRVLLRKDARESGLTRYFTGIPCIRGHVAERTTNYKKCVECTREKARKKYHCDVVEARRLRYAYKLKNAEAVVESGKKYYQAHRARILEQKREYAASTKEARKAYRAKRYSENREAIKAASRAYRLANPERVRASMKAWAAENKDILQKHRRARKARDKGAIGSHSVQEVAAIREMQRNKCAYCRKPLSKTAHLDHIVALACGGSNEANNLQWLCASCNLSKNKLDPIVFAQSRGLLL